MKQRLFLLLAILLLTNSAMATTHNIVVADYSFSPSTLTVALGDTIMWTWSSGTHTTTSTTIPSGATSWNANINSSSTTFIYVPTMAGTYNYQCTFHVSMGMTGSFTVNTTAVPAVNNSLAVVNLYPNPASNTLHISMPLNSKSIQVAVSDMEGKKMFSGTYKTQDIDIDLSHFANGVYFVHVLYDKNAYMQKLFIAH